MGRGAIELQNTDTTACARNCLVTHNTYLEYGGGWRPLVEARCSMSKAARLPAIFRMAQALRLAGFRRRRHHRDKSDRLSQCG